METSLELKAHIVDLFKQYREIKDSKSDLFQAASVAASEIAPAVKPELTAAINANKALKTQLDTLLREVNLKQILASLS